LRSAGHRHGLYAHPAAVLAHGYAVNISVEQSDGKVAALPEYQIVVEQGSATCYVESTAGKVSPRLAWACPHPS
jgi:hypothetical protein